MERGISVAFSVQKIERLWARMCRALSFLPHFSFKKGILQATILIKSQPAQITPLTTRNCVALENGHADYSDSDAEMRPGKGTTASSGVW